MAQRRTMIVLDGDNIDRDFFQHQINFERFCTMAIGDDIKVGFVLFWTIINQYRADLCKILEQLNFNVFSYQLRGDDRVAGKRQGYSDMDISNYLDIRVIHDDFDRLILATADTDFANKIKLLQQYHRKRVEVVFASDVHVSSALIEQADYFWDLADPTIQERIRNYMPENAFTLDLLRQPMP